MSMKGKEEKGLERADRRRMNGKMEINELKSNCWQVFRKLTAAVVSPCVALRIFGRQLRMGCWGPETKRLDEELNN